MWLDGRQVQRRLAVGGLGAGRRDGDRPGRAGCRPGAAAAPEPACRAGTPAGAGPPGQRRTLERLVGAATLHRGGVHDPPVVAPPRGVGGDGPDGMADEPCHPAQAQVAVAMTSQPAAEVTPSRAWLTARVTGSASDTLDAIPTGGRHRARQGLASAAHPSSPTVRWPGCPRRRPPGLQTRGWVSNPDHGHPLPTPHPLGINPLGRLASAKAAITPAASPGATRLARWPGAAAPRRPRP